VIRQKLLKHKGGITKLKPAPANFSLGVVFCTFRNPRVLHFEAKPVHIEAQGNFHVRYAEERHGLLDVKAWDGRSGYGFTSPASLLMVAVL
jgi:hypothetical protein